MWELYLFDSLHIDCTKQPLPDQELNFHQLQVLPFKRFISDVPSVKRGDFLKITYLDTWPMLYKGFEQLKDIWAFLQNRKDKTPKRHDNNTTLMFCTPIQFRESKGKTVI